MAKQGATALQETPQDSLDEIVDNLVELEELLLAPLDNNALFSRLLEKHPITAKKLNTLADKMSTLLNVRTYPEGYEDSPGMTQHAFYLEALYAMKKSNGYSMKVFLKANPDIAVLISENTNLLYKAYIKYLKVEKSALKKRVKEEQQQKLIQEPANNSYSPVYTAKRARKEKEETVPEQTNILPRPDR